MEKAQVRRVYVCKVYFSSSSVSCFSPHFVQTFWNDRWLKMETANGSAKFCTQLLGHNESHLAPHSLQYHC